MDRRLIRKQLRRQGVAEDGQQASLESPEQPEKSEFNSPVILQIEEQGNMRLEPAHHPTNLPNSQQQ